MKTCSKCLEILPIDSFPSDKTSKDRKSSQCRFCHSKATAKWKELNKSKLSSYNKEWRQTEKAQTAAKTYYERVVKPKLLKLDPVKRKRLNKRRSLQRKYGISLEEFEILSKSQDNLCAICRANVPLSVDHCHQTGKIRGLLCNTCNRAIGLLKDNITVLEQACSYLSKNASV